MENLWLTSALWIGLAFVAALVSIQIAVSAAPAETVAGAIAGSAR
jgi:hypothetical protein